jgi:hypothetical protein
MNIFFRLCVYGANKIYPILERLIPVKQEFQQRPNNILSYTKVFIPGLNIRNRSDYILCCHLVFSFTVMMLIAFSIYMDALLSSGIFIDNTKFNENPLSIAVSFRNISVLPWIIITIAFYIRIRFSMNLAIETPPINCHPALLDDRNQGKWVVRSSIVLLVSPIVTCFSYGFVIGVARYLDKQESIFVAVIGTTFIALATAVMSVFFVMHAILVEKSYRYFDDFKTHLDKMINNQNINK